MHTWFKKYAAVVVLSIGLTACSQEEVVTQKIATKQLQGSIQLQTQQKDSKNLTRLVSSPDTIKLAPLEGDGPMLKLVVSHQNPAPKTKVATRGEDIASLEEFNISYTTWHPNTPNDARLRNEILKQENSEKISTDIMPYGDVTIKSNFKITQKDQEDEDIPLFGMLQFFHNIGEGDNILKPSDNVTFERDEQGIINKFSVTYQAPAIGYWFNSIPEEEEDPYFFENYATVSALKTNNIYNGFDDVETLQMRGIYIYSHTYEDIDQSGLLEKYGKPLSVRISNCYRSVTYTASRVEGEESISEHLIGDPYTLEIPVDENSNNLEKLFIFPREDWAIGTIKVKFSQQNEQGKYPVFTYDMSNSGLDGNTYVKFIIDGVYGEY